MIGLDEDRVGPPPGLLGFLGRLATLGLAALAWGAALLVQMAPLGIAPDAVPAPDLAFCALAWAALARPDALPAPAAFALALATDLISGGPAGAAALGLFWGIEALKAWARFQDRPSRIRDLIAVGLAYSMALLLPWLLMRLSFAGGPPLTDLGLRWLVTMAAAVPTAAAMRFGLGLRRIRPAEPAPGLGR